MKSNGFFTAIVASILILTACRGNSERANQEEQKVSIREQKVAYSIDSLTMNGFVAYNEALAGKRPVVLIIHEWWGLNEYPKMRARQLAEKGYLAMAVDIYGNGKTADNPGDAQKLAMPFYQNPESAKQRFDAALATIKGFPQADTSKIAAIGYCFGGGTVLNLARLGEDLKGVVSFHGSLLGAPADKNKLKADVMVCHGEADSFVKPDEVNAFKKQMDSVGALYTFKSYAGATHAFTNPAATETGKKFSLPIAYNAAADTASFNDMMIFFGKIFQ